eukprot:scpid80201/ scgid24630/ 
MAIIVDNVTANRRFWSTNVGCPGFFEKRVKGWWLEVMQALQEAGKEDDVEDYLDRQYVKTFRVSKPLFDAIYTDTHALWEKSDTALRCAVNSEKRLAMLLYWLAHATTQDELANLFGVGQSTVHEILHDGVDTLALHLGKKSIFFRKEKS